MVSVRSESMSLKHDPTLPEKGMVVLSHLASIPSGEVITGTLSREFHIIVQPLTGTVVSARDILSEISTMSTWEAHLGQGSPREIY